MGRERRLKVVQVVRSDAFAGVERYICSVANSLNDLGHSVHVIGGDPERMQLELAGDVSYSPGRSTTEVSRSLLRVTDADIVHAHMTAAEAAAVVTRPWHRAAIISTRHFPSGRGSDAYARMAAPIIRSSLEGQIAISRFVANNIGERSVLIYNGVPPRDQAALKTLRVLMMQRLEREKAPEVGVRAWAASGLASLGWTMDIAGNGSLEGVVRRVSESLGVFDSVRFLGRLVDTDGLLGATSILLAPAPAEPFGLSVTEAMAHGIPVVAAEGGAHVETLRGAGCFFTKGDISGAAGQLRRLADDDRLRRAVGGALRSRQRRLFNLERHVERLAEYYSSTLAQLHRRYR